MKALPITSPSTAGFAAELAAGDVLHLWMKAASGSSEASVDVTSESGNRITLRGPLSDDYQLVAHVVEAPGVSEITWGSASTSVSICYAYNPANVMQAGIRVLHVPESARAAHKRYRLHLAPPFGWMNDPNGLIELDGRVHAFYQHYPHAKHWDNMHWGHAVSDNLIDWIHLPVFLHPQQRILGDEALKGGAFSGSAIALPGQGIRIFHTDREDGRLPQQEWQITAVSSDLIAAGEGSPVIADQPPVPNFGRDLRDPYVFKGPDGLWKMVLGGADDTSALVLLYETSDPDAAVGWQFSGILHREPLSRPVPAECPCLIALDGEGEGLFALVFGLIGHQSLVMGRLNPSFILVGKFDGRTFVETSRRELDFVGDCYAFQAFKHQTGVLGMAWAANWADVKPGRDFPSAMTFPRQLLWQGRHLAMPPVAAVSGLRSKRIDIASGPLQQAAALADGLAEIDLATNEPGLPFRIMFSHATKPFELVYDGQVLELVGDWAKAKALGVRYRVETQELRRLRVFVDVGLIEIFVDDGFACGTKRLDSDEPVTAIVLDASPQTFKQIDIWQLRPKRDMPSLNPSPDTPETKQSGA